VVFCLPDRQAVKGNPLADGTVEQDEQREVPRRTATRMAWDSARTSRERSASCFGSQPRFVWLSSARGVRYEMPNAVANWAA
jgi:hypothetical protein